MAFLKTEKVAIRGISGCVPSYLEENIDLPFYQSKEEAEHVIEATGIERRHVAPKGMTTSASIPMAIVSERSKEFSESRLKNMVCGFGTGLAWGAIYFETDRIVVPEMQEINCETVFQSDIYV